MVLRKIAHRMGRRPRAPRIPDGERVYAIGDIHGRLDLLDELLQLIAADQAGRPPAQTTLIFLGDLVDRGPDSAGVVARAMDLQASGARVRFLMGNHEEVFLRAASGDARALRYLARIGGRPTILSYGISRQEYDASDDATLSALLARSVPASHISFLSSFEDIIEIGDYAFVHAGIKPGLPLTAQSTSDLRWIRSEFLNHRGPHEKVIVHGHSIVEEPEIRTNRIGIDTGAYASGRLTAIALDGADRWVLCTNP